MLPSCYLRIIESLTYSYQIVNRVIFDYALLLLFFQKEKLVFFVSLLEDSVALKSFFVGLRM